MWLAKWKHVNTNGGRAMISETAIEVLDMFPTIHTSIHILATLPFSVPVTLPGTFYGGGGGSVNFCIFNLITIILTTICIDIGIFKSG
jgi:hypothetical protein